MHKARPRDCCVNLYIFDAVNPTDTTDNDTEAICTNPIPKFFEAHIESLASNNARDFNDPDKNRGFLSLQETNFKFIGRDRDFCMGGTYKVAHSFSVGEEGFTVQIKIEG